MRHRRTEARATAKPRRFACEMAVFINGADVGVWVWPARALGARPPSGCVTTTTSGAGGPTAGSPATRTAPVAPAGPGPDASTSKRSGPSA